MSGPEHYREAERLLAATVNHSVSDVGADHYESTDDGGGYDYSYLMAAQVHATLAQTAATIDAAAHPNQSQVDYLGAWFRATGPHA